MRNQTPPTKENILKFMEEENIDPTGEDYKYEVAKYFYDITSEFNLNFDVDNVENESDCRLQATTYVDRMVGDNGYNVILDVDVSSRFDNKEEFVDEILRLQEIAEKVQNHFAQNRLEIIK